jgi:hypothetical protein
MSQKDLVVGGKKEKLATAKFKVILGHYNRQQGLNLKLD